MSIKSLQESMVDLPQIDCPVTNHFSEGIYARELLIPAGVCIVGAKHKTRHLFMVIQGECCITTDGKERQFIKAPYIGETMPGTKRAITAIEDTRLITFHVTEETDVCKIGADILVPELNLIPQWKKKALEVV